MTSDTARAGSHTAAPARLAAFALALTGLLAAGLLLAPHSASQLRTDLAPFDPWLPVAAVAAYALAVCTFVPGAVLAGASGLLFGAALGTLVAVVSATLGATLAFLLARARAGAARPYRALATARVKGWTTRIERRGFLAVLYARLAPGPPFALVSYAAGVTRIRLVAFAAATALAAAPRAFAYAALGGNLHNYSSPPALAAIAVLAATTIGGAAVLWRARPRQPARSCANRPSPRADSPQTSSSQRQHGT